MIARLLKYIGWAIRLPKQNKQAITVIPVILKINSL